jgi:hypothetical protein
MGNALRDQLLKAGLVDEKQAKKAAKEKHKEDLRRQGQGKTAAAEEETARARQAQAEKAERDRLLNQQRQEQAQQKALAAQIRQLVEQHRVAKEEGETPYHFADGGKVKRLYLSERQRRRLAQGQLAVVRLGQDYELVPAETAEKILARDAASVAVFNDPRQPPAPEAAAEDPYAKFQVPDDLMW